jgi:hypothetical protein
VTNSQKRSAAIALAVMLLLHVACGRRGELLGAIGALPDGGGGASEAGSDSSASSAPRFTTPVMIMPVSSQFGQESDPTFTGDLLEMIFISDRLGTPDLWVSRRLTASDPWGAPVGLPEVSGPFTEEGPAVSLDGTRLWFATDRDGTPGRIWRSVRASRSASWGAPSPVPELANLPGGPAKDASPALDAPETTVMFGSNRLGAQAFDVYFAVRAASGMPWGTPQLVPGINGPFDDWDPFVAQGGLVVFFTSTRQGAGDMFWSARQSTAEPFPAPQPLIDLNSPASDSDATLSQDLTYIVFDSTRSGPSKLYEAHSF